MPEGQHISSAQDTGNVACVTSREPLYAHKRVLLAAPTHLHCAAERTGPQTQTQLPCPLPQETGSSSSDDESASGVFPMSMAGRVPLPGRRALDRRPSSIGERAHATVFV